MNALELKEKYLKDNIKNVGVIAISQNKKNMFWFHIHNEELIPKRGYDIAFHIRRSK